MIKSRKIALTDSTLEICNILVCNSNLLPVYIHSIKICGDYLAVTSSFLDFAQLYPSLTLVESHSFEPKFHGDETK